MTKCIYAFGDGKAEGSAAMRDLLGGKQRLYVFRKARPYQKLCRWIYQQKEKSGEFEAPRLKIEKARMKMAQRETSFWEVDFRHLSEGGKEYGGMIEEVVSARGVGTRSVSRRACNGEVAPGFVEFVGVGRAGVESAKVFASDHRLCERRQLASPRAFVSWLPGQQKVLLQPHMYLHKYVFP